MKCLTNGDDVDTLLGERGRLRSGSDAGSCGYPRKSHEELDHSLWRARTVLDVVLNSSGEMRFKAFHRLPPSFVNTRLMQEYNILLTLVAGEVHADRDRCKRGHWQTSANHKP